MEKVRVIVWGVGRLGGGTVRMMLDKEWIEIVGAIDVARGKAGKDLGEVVGAGRRLGVVISDNPDNVFSEAKANMVLHFTSPNPDETEAQIMKAIAAGYNVISTSDLRLIYPWVDHPAFGARIDGAAKENSVTVLATGRGPGFLFEVLPMVFAGVCAQVKRIAMKRMGSMQWHDKSHAMATGIGLPVAEFKKKVADGFIPIPAGVSAHLIAHVMGWKLDEIKVTVEPITSKKRKQASPDMPIEPGNTCGWRFLISASKGGEEVINLDSTSWIDIEGEGLAPEYRISIEGEPNLEVVVKGFGATAAVENCALVVNRIPFVLEARPGLALGTEFPVAPTPPFIG